MEKSNIKDKTFVISERAENTEKASRYFKREKFLLQFVQHRGKIKFSFKLLQDGRQCDSVSMIFSYFSISMRTRVMLQVHQRKKFMCKSEKSRRNRKGRERKINSGMSCCARLLLRFLYGMRRRTKVLSEIWKFVSFFFPFFVEFWRALNLNSCPKRARSPEVMSTWKLRNVLKLRKLKQEEPWRLKKYVIT